MSNNPTIAVLMATYNGEKFLKEQLDSILAQTYQHFNIYISDDGSTDATVNILSSYQKQYPEKFFYTVNELNLGVVKNFEWLIQNSNEEYIALADQDDIWKSNKLESELNKLISIENNEPAMVHSDLTMIDADGNILQKSFLKFRKIKLSNRKSIHKIISHNGVMGCTLLFNQKLKDNILPFPDNLDVHDYWIALVSEVVGQRYTIFEPLVNYRIHTNNTSNNIKKIQYKRNIFMRLINKDALPFIGLGRDKVIETLLSRFSDSLDANQVNIIHAFLSYLRQDKNPLFIIYYVIKYNLIREDFFYRIKIFIKLIQYKSSRIVKLEYGMTSTKRVMKSTKNFLKLKHYNFLRVSLQKRGIFYGWGRKKSGRQAIALAKKYKTSFVLLEDGFIRSLGLGINGSASFSLVEDDVGIYYDATSPSKLENLLNSYDFAADTTLMADAKRAMSYMVEHNISKYNSAAFVDEKVIDKYELNAVQKRVLLIAQTAGDSSLEYGMLTAFSTDDMLSAALSENPDAKIYLKIHPDVLSGQKKSDIDIEEVKKHCTIIEEDLNPLSLLKYFDKVYTKTSGMGFEALLVGCECVCFGMPFYAGWGITTDKSVCNRRQAKRSVEEIFAAAYILYTRYFNPYKKRDCDIFEVMEEIVLQNSRVRDLLLTKE